MTLNFRSLVVAVALAGAGFAGVSQASAMPLAGAPAATGPIEQVRWGCGPGWHPNPWGRCVPNGYYGPRPYYAPRPYYGPRPYYRPRPYYAPRPYYGPRW